VLRVKREAGLRKRGFDALLHSTQRTNGREKSDRATARGEKQFPHRACKRVHVSALDVLHDEDAGLLGIAEWRAKGRAPRRFQNTAAAR
jgi:hypothetical protein